MTDELMNTRELRELLRLDRTTIYHMLQEGRLPGFKVGGQWRFSRQEVETWLREQRSEVEPSAPVKPSSNALPVSRIQSIQAIFSEAIGVGSIVTQLDGESLTEISNSCAFCDLILSTPAGARRCAASWRALASQERRQPMLQCCHAGLFYARSRIEVEDEFIAMVFAGQVVVDDDRSDVTARLDSLAQACHISPTRLKRTMPSIRSLDGEQSRKLIALLDRLGEALSDIGRERLTLLRKLRYIAEMTTV